MEITFYVTDCSEFTQFGFYKNDLTLEDAVKWYKRLKKKPCCNVRAIGFNLKDNSIYADTDFPLIEEDVINDMINCIDHYRDNELIQQAIVDVKRLLNIA